MKRLVNDEKLMAHVATQYYERGMGQQEIARSMSLSRPTVSRLLARARQTGIVRIIISDPAWRDYVELERELQSKYNLKAVIVTDSPDEKEQMQDAIARGAAQLLERILSNGDLVGVSMGSTLSYIARHVTADYIKGLRFVPMIGGVGSASMQWHSNYLSESLANAFGGEFFLVHAPAMVSRIQTKQELMREESIAKVLELASNLNVAISGIGAPDISSTIIETGYFSKEMINDFDTYGICGDICMNFYNENGNLALYEHNQRVFAINIETLRRTPWSIGIAGGVNKVGAIRGALAGRYINALVTDRLCAERLAVL